MSSVSLALLAYDRSSNACRTYARRALSEGHDYVTSDIVKRDRSRLSVHVDNDAEETEESCRKGSLQATVIRFTDCTSSLACSPEQSPSHYSDDTNDYLSDNDSNASSVVSMLATAASWTQDSTSSQVADYKQKWARKTACCLTDEEEKSMLEFLQENQLLWDIKFTEFRRADSPGWTWKYLR